MQVLTASTALPSYVRGRALASTKTYNGGLLSFLATGLDTGGRAALIEFRGRPGSEPPPHAHEWEHASYFVLEGALDFYGAGPVLAVKAGEVAFAPQGQAHAFRIRSGQVRLLVSVQAVGAHAVGLDQFWLAAVTPAALDLPQRGPAHTSDDHYQARRLGATHGIRFLTPQETTAALPHYAPEQHTQPAHEANSWKHSGPGRDPAESVIEQQKNNALLALTSHETIW